jgi:hypothetical protein
MMSPLRNHLLSQETAPLGCSAARGASHMKAAATGGGPGLLQLAPGPGSSVRLEALGTSRRRTIVVVAGERRIGKRLWGWRLAAFDTLGASLAAAAAAASPLSSSVAPPQCGVAQRVKGL